MKTTVKSPVKYCTVLYIPLSSLTLLPAHTILDTNTMVLSCVCLYVCRCLFLCVRVYVCVCVCMDGIWVAENRMLYNVYSI